MAGEDRREDALHHARQPMGEWLLRKLQWLDARRALERGDLLHLGRGSDPDRSLASSLQHRQAAQLAGLSSTRPGNGDPAMAALRFRFAPPAASHGAGGNLALTINADHSVGAGHRRFELGNVPLSVLVDIQPHCGHSPYLACGLYVIPPGSNLGLDIRR